ncbi:MAG: alkaline phosphatase family protein [Candidatus Thorarchaeota archaeon]
MKKLIFLGLDGLSWNLIEELISNHQLKNFKELINKGASGVLKAEGFLSSPKIFCSIFTGKNVEKHGIRDFYSKESDLKTEQIWDILHNKGFRVGVYRPLSVWSAKKFEGFCIPNPLLLEKTTYPQNLSFISELDKRARSEKYSLSFLMRFFWKLIKFGFPLLQLLKILKRSVILNFKRGLEERMYLLKEIELIIHMNLYLKLIKKYPLDFSVFFDYSFDTLGHIYMRARGEISKYSHILPDVYKLVDKYIGKIYKFAIKNNCHLFICSDHGFERKEKKKEWNYRTINILYLLRELGFYYDVYGIYMTGSVVFRMRPNSSRSLNEFYNAIDSIRCNGQRIFDIKVYEKKLIVYLNDFFGENKDLKVDLPNNKSLNIESIIDFNPGHTGSHSEKYGVFMANGPCIKEGKKIGDVTPYDVAPTILSILDQEIPKDMDGRVLTEICKE